MTTLIAGPTGRCNGQFSFQSEKWADARNASPKWEERTTQTLTAYRGSYGRCKQANRLGWSERGERRLRRGALNTATKAAERTVVFIPLTSAWPCFGATAVSAGATRLRTPTGPAGRHTSAIGAAIRAGQVSEAWRTVAGASILLIAHNVWLLDCRQPQSKLMANISEALHKFNETLGKLSVSAPLGTWSVGGWNRLHCFLEVVYRLPYLISFLLNVSDQGMSQFCFVAHGQHRSQAVELGIEVWFAILARVRGSLVEGFL
jgi:hypothetical protein